MDAPPGWLLGRWRLMRADAELDLAPDTLMDFREGGELLYTLTVQGSEFEIPLVYRVEGDVLLTENPAAPHTTSAKFALGAGQVLVFDFAGPRAFFVRESERGNR